MKTKRKSRVITEMAKELKSQYDCIGRLDAIKYLKNLFPEQPLHICNHAYDFYELNNN